MGLSASQGRLLMLTARQTDLEYQAQQISHQRLALAAKLEDISREYETSVNNRQMIITMQASDGSRVLSNLTYAKLVSGAAALGIVAGLNQIPEINTSDTANSQAFRLTDGESIIVSDISEIPGKITPEYSDPVYETDSDTGLSLYTRTEKQINNSTDGVKVANTKYFALEDIKDSDLEKICKTDSIASICKMMTDGTNYYIMCDRKYNDIDGTYKSQKDYYNKEGNQVTLDATQIENLHEYTYDNGSTNSIETIKFVHDKSSIAQSVTNTISKITEEDLDNNRITVNGISYIIDEELGKSQDGINYLQNCLRNGKYIIERFNPDTKVLENPWKEVDWESASNIYDQYYEADDAAAKAKYDREANQIELQDKKLQLDLDNVETQRNAVKTEMESVKKVINENVEKTFNTFG